MTDEQLNKGIDDYLKGHNIASIAVSDGKNPLVNTVYYVNDGMSVYFTSNSHSRKIHIIGMNSRASLSITEDYSDWSRIRGIEMIGKARLVPERGSQGIKDLFLDKFPQIRGMGGVPQSHIVVGFFPDTVYFLDYSNGFGHKRVVHVEKNKSLMSW